MAQKSRFDLDDLLALSWNWRGSALLIQAHSAGLFDAVKNHWRTPEEIAIRLGSDPRATRLILLALSGIGVVEKSGEKYRNSVTADKYLVSSSPDYRGHLLELDLRAMENWAKIPEVLMTGKPIPKPATTDDEKSEWQKTFTKAMEALSKPKLEKVIAAIPATDVDHLLDIGSGPGLYMIEIAKLLPNFCATLFDRPETGPVAQENINKAGVAERVKFVGGDALTYRFINEFFDGALISQMLHIYPPAEAAVIVKKAAKSVKPGGFVAIQEMTVGPDDNPGAAAVFAVQMMLGTEEGTVYTVDELSGIMTGAGLVVESITAINDRDDVLVGRKPEV